MEAGSVGFSVWLTALHINAAFSNQKDIEWWTFCSFYNACECVFSLHYEKGFIFIFKFSIVCALIFKNAPVYSSLALFA